MAITREQETDLIVAIRNGDKDPLTVSKGDITARVAYQMVQVQPSSVQLVPREHLDADVVKEAILRGGDNALNYLPADIVSPGIEYDEMSDLQRAAADGIEGRRDFESSLEYAIEQNPMAISGIPIEYQKSLIETQDLVKIAGNESNNTMWLHDLDQDLFQRKRYDNESDELRKTDAAYQVMAANPNLIGEMFNAGILDEKNSGDVKAAGHLLAESLDPEGSPHVERAFSGEIEDIPAAVWTKEALSNYASNNGDVANVLMRFEEHAGKSLNNSEKAEMVVKDLEALSADVFKEIRESAAANLMADEDGLSQVKRFALEVDMGERSADVRPAAEGEDAMAPYAEAFLKDSENLDVAENYILDAGRKLDAESLGVVEDVANGNIEAFLVHEKLKTGDLAVGDMSEKQMELMKDIKWESVEVSEDFGGYPLNEAMDQASPGDSAWMSSMERSATVKMESSGGLKLEFGIQSESRSEYQDVETLRDFYTCKMVVDGNSEASINGMPVNPSDMGNLAESLEIQWSSAAHQEIGQIPVGREAVADRKLTDLAIDNTLDVSRNADGDIVISFSVGDPYSDIGMPANFTIENGKLEALGEYMSEAAVSLAETYVTENEQMLAAEVAEFKLKEVGLSKIEVDYETIEGAGQVYFATFNNNGEPGYVGLDSETLKLDSESNGYDKLSEAQVEVLSAELEKHTEGMTPPMGVEMAQRKAEELGELLDKKVEFEDYGDSFTLYEGESAGNVSTMYFQGSYSSATELNQALDDKILEARESITIERDEPKQEVERERQEEPERRGVRI